MSYLCPSHQILIMKYLLWCVAIAILRYVEIQLWNSRFSATWGRFPLCWDGQQVLWKAGESIFLISWKFNSKTSMSEDWWKSHKKLVSIFIFQLPNDEKIKFTLKILDKSKLRWIWDDLIFIIFFLVLRDFLWRVSAKKAENLTL